MVQNDRLRIESDLEFFAMHRVAYMQMVETADMHSSRSKRRSVKYVVVTMCIGGGMGAAGPFEVY